MTAVGTGKDTRARELVNMLNEVSVPGMPNDLTDVRSKTHLRKMMKQTRERVVSFKIVLRMFGVGGFSGVFKIFTMLLVLLRVLVMKSKATLKRRNIIR